MSHTFESVKAFFGDRLEIVGGVLTIYEHGKHTDVGRVDNSTGVFSLTAEGLDILSTAAPKATRRKQAEAAPAVEEVKAPEEVLAE